MRFWRDWARRPLRPRSWVGVASGFPAIGSATQPSVYRVHAGGDYTDHTICLAQSVTEKVRPTGASLQRRTIRTASSGTERTPSSRAARASSSRGEASIVVQGEKDAIVQSEKDATVQGGRDGTVQGHESLVVHDPRLGAVKVAQGRLRSEVRGVLDKRRARPRRGVGLGAPPRGGPVKGPYGGFDTPARKRLRPPDAHVCATSPLHGRRGPNVGPRPPVVKPPPRFCRRSSTVPIRSTPPGMARIAGGRWTRDGRSARRRSRPVPSRTARRRRPARRRGSSWPARFRTLP